jgi:hypothetical protein
MWEIPIWLQYKDYGSPHIPMDYTGDASDILEKELQKRYTGNRVPLGIFLHSGWLQTNEAALKSWTESILGKYSDVHYFVTSYELIE